MLKFVKFVYCLRKVALYKFSESPNKLYMRFKEGRETGSNRAVVRIDLYNKEIYIFNGFMVLFFDPVLQMSLRDLENKYNNA